MEKPITELSNALSESIDVMCPKDIISCLEKCDFEIFHGWGGSGGSLEDCVLKKLNLLTEIISTTLKDPDSLVLLCGCGTSGRLAFFLSRAFNIKIHQFDYLISGADKALFKSQEAYEDDPHVGKSDLIKACEGKHSVIYIGITCGLSAPYIAGQLDYCMDNLDKFTPVLLGFNPLHLSRSLPIENWDKTFLQVAKRLESVAASQKGFIINPIIGPESITGSSRMKGGSATKILLEVVLSLAIARIQKQHANIQDMIKAYDITREAVYASDALSDVMELAGRCLQQSGHIYYISHEKLGWVGMLDASECPPTYGAGYDDVRGFIAGGYEEYGNSEGDMSHYVEISMDYFMNAVVPTLTDRDVVIVLSSVGCVGVDTAICTSGAHTVLINIPSSAQQSVADVSHTDFEVIMEVVLPAAKLEAILPVTIVENNREFYTEMACKWICNAISTGAHIMRGKVYQNIMVDVTVSNNKLFHRAVGIIQRVSKCGEKMAVENLLKAIYTTDSVSDVIRTAPTSDHIRTATPMTMVVPVALVMSLVGCDVQEAREMLQQSPVIRTAIDKVYSSRVGSS